jgi:hypothetical protein
MFESMGHVLLNVTIRVYAQEPTVGTKRPHDLNYGFLTLLWRSKGMWDKEYNTN